MSSASTLAIRILADNPNHHLFLNNGTWWIHYSVTAGPHLKARRMRASLRTRSLQVARERRDAFFAHQQMQSGRLAGTEVAA